jgi:acetyl-CoA carboxylase carboxyltransferase component
MIIAHIPTLSGAAWNEFTLIKQNRMTEIATQNRLPLIALVQSVVSQKVVLTLGWRVSPTAIQSIP